MDEHEFRMEVVQRLARIETKLQPLQLLEPRITSLERFKYQLIAIATFAGGTATFLLEHATSVMAAAAAIVHKVAP